MELTLTNIQTFGGDYTASLDFEADVLIDGVLAGNAYNRDSGFYDTVHWVHDKELGHRFEAWLDDQTMPVDVEDGKIRLLESVEEKLHHIITEILDRWEARKRAGNVVEIAAARA